MSFLKGLLKFFALIGLIIVVSVLVFCVLSVYREDKPDNITSDDTIEVYQQDQVADINMYIVNNTLNISTKFKEDKEKDFCLSYAYYYYDTYHYNVNLTVTNKEYFIFITINNNGKSSILESKQLILNS